MSSLDSIAQTHNLFRGCTILVVDDEKVVRDGCQRMLAPEGYQVLTAENGQEGLDVLGVEPVNLILCDLKMPVMGALEFLERASVHYPQVPVIIITGHGTVQSAVECMRRGAYDLITKPFRVDHLAIVVRRALEKQHLERRAQELQEEQAKNLYDLAAAQSRIRTIVNCMADGVLITNRNLEVVLCNSTLERLLNLPGPPLQSRTLSADGADAILYNTLKELLEAGAKDNEPIIAQVIHSGRTHARAMSALIRGPEQEVLGTVTVLHDITRFVELDEMKSNFVQMVSHELRAPLAAIKQQHTVILAGMAGELSDKQKELLSRAEEKIQGLLDLINDLLDVSKIESGHGLQQLSPLQLDQVLEKTVNLLAVKAEAQNVLLRLTVTGELPLVQADPQRMEEVFTNLIANAINYSPDGGTVTVSAGLQGSCVAVTVEDTGVGIESEEIPKIFEKFYRVKHAKTRKVIGTGLGLSITKSIIEVHRGSIEVESTPGVGSSFRVLLPALPA